MGFKCPAELFTPDAFDFKKHHASLFAFGHETAPPGVYSVAVTFAMLLWRVAATVTRATRTEEVRKWQAIPGYLTTKKKTASLGDRRPARNSVDRTTAGNFGSVL